MSAPIKIDTVRSRIQTSNESNRSTNATHSIMTHVETFKSSIIRIRDLLRSQAITGMDSMRHICLYLMSRYMTREKALALGIPNEFAWETLMELTLTVNGGLQYALDRFYHKEGDCLVNHFDRLFGTEKFPFDVKSLARHKETLEILDKVNIAAVDFHMDVLGWVYEQHLKTGSSAARDLGQYFTDRSICTYMTELCRPGFKYPGVPESMCDPSMGTGGFQAAYMKYYKRHHPDVQVDWAIQQKEIHGCDTDQKVAGVARLNLFMEAGGARFDHLLHQDSLYGDLPQTGYDVILANMPFGIDGLKHAECCERVKALKIRGTKSEPLFLQLIMVSLKAGGRCAVVVPDGMLVNTSACHNGTRKYLLDHFELKRIIKMRGKFFMNTTIKPSILFFENTGNPTAAVEFWDVVADANGSVEETMVLSVPRAALDEACSLDMRRYQEVKVVANPAGFPMVKLGYMCDLLGGKGNYTQDGDTYPYYDSNGITGTRKDYLYDGEYVVTARKMSIGAVHYVSGKYWASDNTINLCVKPESGLSGRFLYYWLLLNNRVLKDLSSGIKPGIRKSDVEEITMPLPPLAIQQEIVATLDRIYASDTTELADTLKLTSRAMDLVLAQPSGVTLEPIVEAQLLMRKSAQMVADVKAQMVAIVKSVGCRGFPMATLEAICNDVSTNKNIPSSERKDGAFRFFTCSRDSSTHNEAHYEGTYIVHGSRGSTISDSIFLTNNEKFSIGTSMFMSAMKDTATDIKYVYYHLKCNKDIVDTLVNSSAIPMISKTAYYTIKIPLPPLAFQHALIARMDALQSQLAALESLQRQSEDNARFILESYLHTGASSADDAPQASSASASEDDEKEEPLARSTPIRRPRSVSPARSEAESENASAVATLDYESMSLTALKDMCKARGLRGLSGKKKEELVVILRDLS
jgi:type I restriction enzyme M protein